MILDPSLAKDILVKNFKNFEYNTLTDGVRTTLIDGKKPLNFDNKLSIKIFIYFLHYQKKIDKEVDPLFGRNPFFQKEDDWKQTRNEISPAFTVIKVR